MKNKYIIGGLAAALASTGLISCSDDYLNQEPITQVSKAQLATSDVGAETAVTGLAMLQQKQYSNLKNGNLNASGELFFRNVYGEGLGPDANFGEITNYLRSGITPSNFRLPRGWWGTWMYNYAYCIIGSANSVLAMVSDDDATMSSQEMWLKASALTERAHAYTRLMQVYAPRWIDSEGGQAKCLVLRLETGEENDKPFSTCNEVFDQMYSDLKEAITLFERANKQRGEDLFYTDEHVAAGILSRLALLKNDYKTAQEMAHYARQGFPIMSAKDYLGGFSTTNAEWMWAPAMDPLGTYYWGFGPHYACNGHYTISWGYSTAMSPELYNKMSETDVRAQLYFGPLCCRFEPEMAAEAGVTEDDFNDPAIYSQQTSLVSLTGAGAKPTGKNLQMWNFIMAYGKRFNSMRPEDIKGIYLTNSKGLAYGTAYKFQGLDDGYTSCWPPYMRAAEMLLNEAEAACMNGDEATAKSCLTELMAKRDPEYKLTASGPALLEEVKLQRRIELWGEGFNWFDLKRWNENVNFKGLNKENPGAGGNFPNTVVMDYPASYMNGWRAAIPEDEFTYNKGANPAEVGL